MLSALSKLIEARDPFMRGHASRVTALAEPVARRLGWGDDELKALELGGRLHDVGKLGVSQQILCKAQPLDDEEIAEIRAHPAHGAALISSIAEARPALPYVLHHHERWDGRGYPSGLTAREIPAEARLIAVADAFDAMTSTRPYRHALPPAYALAEIERCAGTQFDPDVARVFAEVWALARRVAAG